MSRDKILSFTREYYDKHGVSPSIRAIADGVDGVDRKNFYQYFKDKNELLVALGIQEEVIKPEAAMEAKKRISEKGDKYSVTLNRSQSEKLIALAYMTGKTTMEVIDEILEDQRQIREIMDEVNEGTLDADVIHAILNQDLVYEGYSVSKHAGKPWLMMKCNRCGDPIFLGEEINYTRWLFETMPMIRRMFSVTCSDCVPKPPGYNRIPA